MKQTKIIADRALINRLMEAFGMKKGSIYNILSFRREGSMAKSIREFALQNGGKMAEVEKIIKIKEISVPHKPVKTLDRRGNVIAVK